VLRNYLSPTIAAVTGPQGLQDISENSSSIEKLSPPQMAEVRNAFAVGYNKQMELLTGFGGAALLASLLLWERKPRALQ
jgi:hypothetical protein